MEMPSTQLNLAFAWIWMLLGFMSGLVLGLFFQRENWLGGYGSLKRRMFRLGHISFFGLGAVNLLFWLTMREESCGGALVEAASWAFIVGGVSMPVCCVAMAFCPRARLFFPLPVLSLVTGGALTAALVLGGGVFPQAHPQEAQNSQTRGHMVRALTSP